MTSIAEPLAAARPASRNAAARTGIIHIHSDYSRDGCDSLETLHDLAASRGIGFIALSDHAEDFTPQRFDEFVRHCRAASSARVTLIPGLEYRFAGHAGLHLIAFGLREWMAPATPAEFIGLAPPRCAMTLLAHPVLARYRVPDAVLSGIDAIEVWNAAYNTRYLPDPRSIRLVHAVRRSRPHVVATAGLDQHDASNDRELRVIVDEADGNPLAALRAGRFTNVGLTMRFDPAVSWTPARLAVVSAARWLLDRVNDAHDLAVRAMRGWRSG